MRCYLPLKILLPIIKITRNATGIDFTRRHLVIYKNHISFQEILSVIADQF